MKKWNTKTIATLIELRSKYRLSWEEVSKKIPGTTPNSVRKAYKRFTKDIKTPEIVVESGPRILVLDLETKPLISYTWGIWDQNVALNQILEDWSILSYACKWYGSDQIFYEDTSKQKDVKNDKELLASIWKLLDSADIILGQNLVSFDLKKLNAKFIQHGFPPPSSYRTIDTLRIAKKYFAFTSNKLEYMSNLLCKQNRKSKHSKFSGFELWSECLKGNKVAWEELREYNINDILATEELYNVLKCWDKSIDFNVYSNSLEVKCSCGSLDFKEKGFVFSNSGKYKRYICKDCGRESRDKENLLTKEKKKKLRK